jgi:L-seryl-tRNA(Ser) seleniumtransferase
MSDPSALLRRIPQVERLLSSPELEPLLGAYPRRQVVRRLQETLEDLRRRITDGAAGAEDLAPEAIAGRVGRLLERRFERYYRRVVNGTGVVLHTNLGRAPLAPEVAAAVAELATGAQRLEIDLDTGGRGGRDRGCTELLVELTGCRAATVVNNNAAATLLILAALARGREVLVSRGELVEIGGSFRVPEIMAESGAVLREVGTTNRTHPRDYRDALSDATGMILKVHTSNYRVVGFTGEVGLVELVAIGRERGVPVVHDLGSGCLVDLAAHGLPGEDLVAGSIATGADLVCFSGDKLLGGPQAGVIAGTAEAVERCRSHPLYRAMRPGRLTYTALEETLRLYLQGEETAAARIPALRRLLAGSDELKRRAGELVRRLEVVPGLAVSLVECASQAGSGSLPLREIPSWGARVRPLTGSVDDLAASLRSGDPAVIGRVREDAIVFDVRTLGDHELAVVEERLAALAGAG